jgi:uncharacterized protein (DUF433 family)
VSLTAGDVVATTSIGVGVHSPGVGDGVASEKAETGLREARTMSVTSGTQTTYEHVEIDPHGAPIVSGTTMKVVELVTAQRAYGWSPEELHFQHPYLTLGEIHSALAYYWDHQQELDADIERRWKFAEKARREAAPSPLMERLRAQGLLP